MDKTTSRQTIKLLMVLLGVVLLVVSYFSIRPGLVEKTEKLAAESAKLAAQLGELTDLETNEATYTKRTKEYEQGIKEILDRYPANILEEDVILYAPELIGKRDMLVSVIAITEPEHIAGMNDPMNNGTADGAAASASGELGILEFEDAVCPNYELFGVGATYDFVAGYRDVKSVIAQILSDPDKRSVPLLSLTYDAETGLLVGNVGVSMFYITGTDKVYTEPDAGAIKKGADNIFGTIEVPRVEE